MNASTKSEPRRRRWVVPVLWAVSVIVALALGWAAAVQVTTPEQITMPEQSTVTVEVSEQTLRVEQTYIVNAAWPETSSGINGYAGTLTSVVASGAAVQPGDELYTVDLQPVVGLQGAVPAFRDLEPGIRGEDVKQLQSFLIAGDYLGGEPTSEYDAATAAAVAAWSEDAGFGAEQTVPRGRVVFLPEMPVNVGLTADVGVGSEVMPGQEVVSVVSSEPRFSLPVLEDAASRIQSGMLVEIAAGSNSWQAQVAELTASVETGALEAVLEPVEGESSICGDDCADFVASSGGSQLQGTLILVPETTGPAVPTAAIRVDAQGETTVQLEDGSEVGVTVLASADGLSVVEGLDVGQQVTARAAADEQP